MDAWDSSQSTGAGVAAAVPAYVRLLLATMRWKVGSVFLLLVAAGLVQGIGLLMLLPLLQVVGLEVEAGSTDRIAQEATDVLSTVGLRATLGSVLAIYVAIIGLQAVLLRRQATESEALEAAFVLRLRQRLFRAIAFSEWRFLTRQRSSDLTYALTDELDVAGGVTSSLLALASQSLIVTLHLLLAFHLSVPLSVLALGTGALLLVLLHGRNRRAHAVGEEVDRASQSLYAAAVENLAGMKTSKCHGAEARDAAIFSARSERVARAYVAAAGVYAGTDAWFRVGSVLILSTLLYAGLHLGDLAPAGVLLLLFLFSRLVPRFSAVQAEFQSVIGAMPAFRTVWTIIEQCESAAEPPAHAADQMPLRVAIRLDRVSFRYTPGDGPDTLAEIDLCVAAHRTTAIVGASGAGKSTLADLVAGVLEPDRGKIMIDDQPLTAARRRAWRMRVGFVPQDIFLFHDTIRANLLWACPSASEDALHAALHAAAADDFVRRLPNGIDTVLGDRGARLSGGERQRIALARALLRRPELLILDEATSALDSENESRIQEAIARLHGRMTIVVITHRLSTIRHADTIYVIDGGRLIEAGSWAELTRPEQRFAAMYAASVPGGKGDLGPALAASLASAGQEGARP
jgi:ATP-binding cassette subfamily C protein